MQFHDDAGPVLQRVSSVQAPLRGFPSQAAAMLPPGQRFYWVNAPVVATTPWLQHYQERQPEFRAGPNDSEEISSEPDLTHCPTENDISSEATGTTLSSGPQFTESKGASRPSPESPRGRRRRARIERREQQDRGSQSCLRTHGKTLLVAMMGLFIVTCITADVLDRRWTSAALMNAPMVNVNRPVGGGLMNVTGQKDTGVARALSTATRTTTRAPSRPPGALTSGKDTSSKSSSKKATTAGHGGREENGTAEFKVKHGCGAVQYTYCPRLRKEFYYDRESATCTDVTAAAAQSVERDLAPDGSVGLGNAELQLCNTSPNRFLTLEACRQVCQHSEPPAESCLKKTVFSKCGSDKGWPPSWYFDGHHCRSWNFGKGRCPDGHVFSTQRQCSSRCHASRTSGKQKRGRPHSCRQPRSRACPSGQRHRYFPFFAHVSPSGGRIRCLQASPAVLVARRCLVGTNRFSSAAECRDSCVRDAARKGADKTSVPKRPRSDEAATDLPMETQPSDE